MKWKFSAHKWAAKKFASGRFAGVGADAPVVTYTGAALDYYCLNAQPYYNVLRSRAEFTCLSTRLFYGLDASDRWTNDVVPTVTLRNITLEDGFALLLEDDGTMQQE